MDDLTAWLDRAVRNRFRWLENRPCLTTEDVFALTIYFAARAVRGRVWKSRTDPEIEGGDADTCVRLALESFCRLYTTSRSGSGSSPTGALPTDAISMGMARYDEWAARCWVQLRRLLDGEPMELRWIAVLAYRVQVQRRTSSLDNTQIRKATRKALVSLGEFPVELLGDSDGRAEGLTADDVNALVQSALLEAKHVLRDEKGNNTTGTFLGRDGKLLVGWTQIRDAVEKSRGINRKAVRARQKASAQPHLDALECADKTQAVAELVHLRDARERLDEYVRRRSEQVAPGSSLAAVLEHLPALLRGDMTASELSRASGLPDSGIRKALEREKQAALDLLKNF